MCVRSVLNCHPYLFKWNVLTCPVPTLEPYAGSPCVLSWPWFLPVLPFLQSSPPGVPGTHFVPLTLQDLRKHFPSLCISACSGSSCWFPQSCPNLCKLFLLAVSSFEPLSWKSVKSAVNFVIVILIIFLLKQYLINGLKEVKTILC